MRITSRLERLEICMPEWQKSVRGVHDGFRMFFV